MYDRTERKPFFAANDTPGPGTYNIPSDRDYREENVPFRFKVGHTSIWNESPGPAPNAYAIKYRKHRIKGAAWSRLTEKKPFAKYKLEDEELEGEERINRSADEAAAFWYQDNDSPKLWRGRAIKYFKKDDEESSTIIEKLDLRKYYAKTYKDNMKKCTACEKYRGPRWSKYKAERFSDKPLNDHPGPGEYDVDGDGPSEETQWYGQIRFYKRAISKIQRYTDQIECEYALKDEPSPADTAIYSENIWKKKSFNVKGTFGNPPPKVSNKPPVTEIRLPSPEKTWRKVVENKAPFNVSSTRHDTLPDLPGPADYNPPQGTIQFKLCKKLPPNNAKYVAPFGTTALQRPLLFDPGIPDPAAYDATIKPRPPPYGARISTFTCRRDELRAEKENALSPAYYDVVTAYDNLKKKCVPCKRRAPFDSSGPRLASIKIDYDIPGPGSYKVSDASIKPGASVAINMGSTSASRGGDKKSEGPGPGAYNIHPLYKDATVKAHCTHNVTLVPYPNFYPLKPHYGPPLPKTILKTFVKSRAH